LLDYSGGRRTTLPTAQRVWDCLANTRQSRCGRALRGSARNQTVELAILQKLSRCGDNRPANCTAFPISDSQSCTIDCPLSIRRSSPPYRKLPKASFRRQRPSPGSSDAPADLHEIVVHRMEREGIKRGFPASLRTLARATHTA